MKKYIKWMIYFILLLIIVLVVVLLINNKSVETSNDYNYIEDTVKETFVFNTIEDKNKYFIVKNIMNRYINYISVLNGDSYINDKMLTAVEREEVIRTQQEDAIKYFKAVFDEEYKEEFNISDELIINESKKYVQQGDYTRSDIIYNLIIKDMYEYNYTNDITLFLVSSNIKDTKLDLLIKYDNINQTYSIFLSDYIEKYNYSASMDIKNININKVGIESNIYNKIILGTINEESIAKEYFNILKNNLLYDLKEVYNKLDDEFKEKKYSDYSEFEKYFSDIKTELSSTKLAKYKVKYENNKDTYILIDTNDKYYIIENSGGLTNYKVILDTYTIDLPEFTEKYEKANEQEKVILNTNRVITALNAKDYRYIYSKLADSFKNNYFQTEEALKEFLVNNLYENNDIDFEEFSQEGTNLYTYKVRITKILSEEEKEKYYGKNAPSQNMNIVMQLNEGTDFVMSFSIAE